MQLFNLSATLNVSRLLYNPALCLPHITVKSFDQLTIPFRIPNHEDVKIKGVVLDKDNCFAKDHDDKVWPEYEQTWQKLIDTYPAANLLIVSNSAGTNDDINHEQAQILESKTGVTVLRHSIKKPGCYEEILSYFKKLNVKPNEILVIGDRLFTDVLMANLMGSWSCWINEGVELSNKIFPKLERQVYQNLVSSREDDPWKPPIPIEK
ncbi:uncharacterized protein KGF55_002821 [Candida pseudojiufengensis]|uniref:uncharacterized protein n=1 Tax=Candida pseudojiufengensis TaxID=497109 RepID=UPI0022256F31|nr:uncharacterized protein KGF55_002821 [Candida pseudojiufengensis]KAI5963029.1 hypothetical protein KGF55_002821 [Candida pseudojiufengensis]